MPRNRVKIFEYVCDGCGRAWTREQHSDDIVPPPKWQILIRSREVGYNIHTTHEFYCDACEVPEIENGE